MAEQKEEVKENGTKLRDDLLDILSKCLVSSLKVNENVVILDSKTDPKKGIEVLIENKIRAAPVIDAASNKFIGVLDLRDTVKFVVESYASVEKKEKQLALEYLTGSPQITSNTLRYLCQMRAFRTVKGSDSVLDAAKVFAAGSHIVGVVDDSTSKLVGILSQGSLFQQVAEMWVKGPLKEEKEGASPLLSALMELKYITSPVKSVSSKVTALSAFESMSKLDLSGLAVVNDEGALIHNTSATDIKLWLSASSMLNMSIEAFLIEIRKASLDERYPVTMCSPKDSFVRAVKKLQATKYHRLWIVDADKKPIGVLALTDIFKFVCKTKEQ